MFHLDTLFLGRQYRGSGRITVSFVKNRTTNSMLFIFKKIKCSFDLTKKLNISENILEWSITK